MRNSINPGDRKAKVALLLNMIAPARLGLYSFLAEQFHLLILHGGREANRDSWHDMHKKLPNARVVRAWGWQIQYGKKVSGTVFDQKFIHITPGIVWHLLRFGPDAVITNEMGLRTVIALAYGSLFRKPVWVWWGGTLHTERTIGGSRKVVRRIVSLWAKHWISYGQTSTEYLLHLGIKRERILESQNAIDETKFRVDVPAAWSLQPRPVVLHVGQFIERKGIGFLLDAVASAQKQGYEFSLLLVGSGRDRAALEQRSKDIGLKNVHFRSSQAPDKMPAVYHSADVLVFPTREDVWGLVANEAVLSGLPVLCSKYAGCAPELFEPESIFSPEDPAEFAQKLKEAIAGRLPRPDATRLKTTEQLGSAIVDEVNRFLRSGGNSDLRTIPVSSLDAKLQSRNENAL
jgi:glycosyltransferase involved in cell wall biosynthesis